MSTDIKELAQRKVNLGLQLQAIGMCNVYDRSNEDLVGLEMDKIKAMRELNQVEMEIREYVEGKTS